MPTIDTHIHALCAAPVVRWCREVLEYQASLVKKFITDDILAAGYTTGQFKEDISRTDRQLQVYLQARRDMKTAATDETCVVCQLHWVY